MKTLIRKPNRREMISYCGISSIFAAFLVALVVYLSVLTPASQATQNCSTEWFIYGLAQADFYAAVDILMVTQSDYMMCEMTTPGNCGTQSFIVGLAEADLQAAQWMLNDAMADAVACEAGH